MQTQDIVETWRQEAIQEGVQQGVQQGIQQGIQQMLLRQVRRRFGVEVDPHVEQRIATASVEQIETWSERVLTAATLAELLTD